MTLRQGRLTVIDVNEPHGVTRNQCRNKCAKIANSLRRLLAVDADESRKQRVNADRASGRGRAQ